MKLTRQNVIRVVLGVAGTIILSAVGSGLWESVLGPGLHAGRNWILNSISLVFSGYKNEIYAQIARDNGGAASIQSLYVTIAIYFFLFVMAISDMAARQRTTEIGYDDLSRKLQADLNKPSDPEVTLEQLKVDVAKAAVDVKRMRKYIYTVAGMVAILVTSHMISYLRISYVDSASGHYHQALSITSPYLSPEQRIEIESQFSQIKDRQDYATVLGRLTDEAKSHGVAIPSFDAW